MVLAFRTSLGLSNYLVCLVHLVSLMQPDKPNEQDRLASFFSILPAP